MPSYHRDRNDPSFKSHKRDGFDGYKRLAAAVIVEAVRDLSHRDDKLRQSAIRFLKSSMEPYSLLIDLPEGAVDHLVRKAEEGTLDSSQGRWKLSLNL